MHLIPNVRKQNRCKQRTSGGNLFFIQLQCFFLHFVYLFLISVLTNGEKHILFFISLSQSEANKPNLDLHNCKQYMYLVMQ